MIYWQHHLNVSEVIKENSFLTEFSLLVLSSCRRVMCLTQTAEASYCI